MSGIGGVRTAFVAMGLLCAGCASESVNRSYRPRPTANRQDRRGPVAPARPGTPPQRVTPSGARLAAKPSVWKEDVSVKSRTAYDSNVWLLSPAGVRRFDRRSTSQQISKRFANVDEVDDITQTAALRAGVGGPSPLGNSMKLYTDVEYKIYTKNSERSHGFLELNGRQSIGDDGKLYLRVAVTPDYFTGNSFIDGVDANFNGRINTAERIYMDTRYDKWKYSAEYVHEFAKSGKSRFLGVEGALELSLDRRFYHWPFKHRDHNRLGFDTSVEVDLGRVAVISLEYGYGQADVDAVDEVVLLDEPKYRQGE